MDKDSFSGYFSDSEITDIDEKYIGSTIDVEDLTKISRQLDVSMGSMMNLMGRIFRDYFPRIDLSPVQDHHREKCAVYFHGKNPGIYKRRNQPAVHYVHVYRGRAVHLDQPAIGAGNHADSVPEMMLTSITGWITFYIDPKIFVEMFVIGVAAYAVVAAIEYRRIRKVPMDEALKNVE